jgi:hypothetical protein
MKKHLLHTGKSRRISLVFLIAVTIVLMSLLEGVTSTTPFQTQALQEADVIAYLRERQIELSVSNGQLNEAAAAWVRREAAKAQFVFLGEEHDISEIPMVAAALWRELVPLGYRHVAIEGGPWLGGRLDRYARFGDERALTQFRAATLPRRPGAGVPPSSEEDIVFYRSLGQAARFSTPLIWGIDHEFKVTPLLSRLVELAPDRDRRILAEELRVRVAVAESAGKYNMQPFKTPIRALIRRFRSVPGSEQEQILDALARRIYGDKFDQERGDVFRQLFLKNYRIAQTAGEKRPRVMLRFGGYHGKRGLMTEYFSTTLANFIAEFGFIEEGSMLNISFIACSDVVSDGAGEETNPPRPCERGEIPWVKPFRSAAEHTWTLFDLRELRESLNDGKLNVARELQDVIAGYDAVVLLKTRTPSRFVVRNNKEE